MANQVFFDIVNSPDDGGWYATIFDLQGKDIDDTDIFPTKQQAINVVQQKYPRAILMETIDFDD